MPEGTGGLKPLPLTWGSLAPRASWEGGGGFSYRCLSAQKEKWGHAPDSGFPRGAWEHFFRWVVAQAFRGQFNVLGETVAGSQVCAHFVAEVMDNWWSGDFSEQVTEKDVNEKYWLDMLSRVFRKTAEGGNSGVDVADVLGREKSLEEFVALDPETFAAKCLVRFPAFCRDSRVDMGTGAAGSTSAGGCGLRAASQVSTS